MSERVLDHLIDSNSLDLGPAFGERKGLGLVKDLMRGSLAGGHGSGAFACCVFVCPCTWAVRVSVPAVGAGTCERPHARQPRRWRRQQWVVCASGESGTGS